jgi:hypothetical protein
LIAPELPSKPSCLREQELMEVTTMEKRKPVSRREGDRDRKAARDVDEGRQKFAPSGSAAAKTTDARSAARGRELDGTELVGERHAVGKDPGR